LTLLVGASGWAAPAQAASTEVGTLAEFIAAVSVCEDGDEMTFTADVYAPTVGIEIPCFVTIDLAGHDVHLAYLDVEVNNRDFALTDTSEDPDPPGTLTLDASDFPGRAALRDSMNSTVVSGRARLVATGGAGGKPVAGPVGARRRLEIHPDMIGRRVSVTATIRGTAISRITSFPTSRIARSGRAYVAFAASGARAGQRVRVVGLAPRGARTYAVASRTHGFGIAERPVPTTGRLADVISVPAGTRDVVTAKVTFYDAGQQRVLTRRLRLRILY
jgi:hypothetical protein